MRGVEAAASRSAGARRHGTCYAIERRPAAATTTSTTSSRRCSSARVGAASAGDRVPAGGPRAAERRSCRRARGWCSCRRGPCSCRRRARPRRRSPNAFYVLRDDAVPDRQPDLQPAGDDRSDAGRGRQLRLQGQRRERLPERDRRCSRTRGQNNSFPGAATNLQHFAVTLDGAARRLVTSLDRLHAVPQRDPVGQRLGDHRRLHLRLGDARSRTCSRAARCRSSWCAISSQQVIGDARSSGAQPGPRRRARRPRAGRAVPARLLPGAGRDRGRRAGDLRALLLRADQADPGHADAAGHRRA